MTALADFQTGALLTLLLPIALVAVAAVWLAVALRRGSHRDSE